MYQKKATVSKTFFVTDYLEVILFAFLRKAGALISIKLVLVFHTSD